MIEDEGADIEWLIQYSSPIERADLEDIQTELRVCEPFVPGVFLADPYDVTAYLPRQMLHREEYTLLVDRNVVTRWIGSVSGQRPTAAHRQAAAIMAFAHAADFTIEPNIAFYELAQHAPQTEVFRELSLFRRGLNAPTDMWADLALGRIDRVAVPEADETEKPPGDLRKPLYRWRRNYILALKLAELHLKGGKPVALMTELMRWMYEEFLIGGPALQLGSLYLAPGAPRRRLLKGIQSHDRQRALSGIRNAAWDLTLISEWLRLVKPLADDPNHRSVYVLCTLDHAVKLLANALVSFDEQPRSDEQAIFQTFETLWGAESATYLASLLSQYQNSAGNPDRALHRQQPDDFIDKLIAEGESAVWSWAPNGQGVQL